MAKTRAGLQRNMSIRNTVIYVGIAVFAGYAFFSTYLLLEQKRQLAEIRDTYIAEDVNTWIYKEETN